MNTQIKLVAVAGIVAGTAAVALSIASLSHTVQSLGRQIPEIKTETQDTKVP